MEETHGEDEKKLKLDAVELENLRLKEENEKLRAQLASQSTVNLVTRREEYQTIENVSSQVLGKVKWPQRRLVALQPPHYVEGCVPKSKATAGGIVAAPNKSDRPSMLLYRLGDPNFVKGKTLKSFNAVQDKQKCAVLLAPSGAGKTRKIYELLHSGLGHFIPFKTSNDKNDGSLALSAVLSLLQSDLLVDWKEQNPSPSLFELRRQRAEFAIHCVLISFTEVYRKWTPTFRNEDPPPFRWLLIQLFPQVFLEADVFEELAVALYKNCDPKEVSSYPHFRGEFYVVLDEAQALGTILTDKFLTSTPGQRESKGLRPVLSAILHGIRNALHRLPIIAGTGLTLLEEWKSIISSMGIQPDFIFTDFPLLDENQVTAMLKKFLIVQNEFESQVAKWLIGRPRWVTQFISEAIEHNKSITDYISDFVQRLTREDDNSPIPRTICASFRRLALKQQRSEAAEEVLSNPYDTALQDAFLLSMGFPILPRESPLLLELGVGFALADAPRKTILKFEPIVLETCRWLVKDNLAFRLEFLRSASEDKSALGKRFEIIAAEILLASFTSMPLETHPVFEGVTLPPVFRGSWKSKEKQEYLFGQVGCKVSAASDFYKRQHQRESILYPDDKAGPDAVIMLRKRDLSGHTDYGSGLTIFMQDKVRVDFDLEKALLSVDPLKLHHQKRGTSEEALIAGVADAHRSYLETLKGRPVIRVVVSVLKPIEGPHVKLIPNGRSSVDLLVILDTTNGHLVYGSELWNYFRRCRFV